MASRRPDHRLNLLENGIDYIKSGVELFFSSDAPRARSHKYALLHMFSGVLLLLKERLARIRRSLVFVHEHEAGQPGTKTINYHQTMRRIEEHGIMLSDAARAVLDEVRELRNAIEHYEVELTLPRTKELIGELASFAYLFCDTELRIDIGRHLSRRVGERFYALKQVGDYLYNLMIETANADAEADEAYFRDIEASFVAMTPDEVQRYAADQNGAGWVRS